jgi:hypothetical protein
MKRHFLAVFFLMLSMTAIRPAHAMFRPALVMADPGYIDTHFTNAETYEPSVGTLDKINGIVDKAHEALHYIGRDTVIDSLNAVSNATNNLVEKGVELHVKTSKLIPQIGFCTAGLVASLCGFGIITHTALQSKPVDAKRKYLIGAAMSVVGFASLMASSWLAQK